MVFSRNLALIFLKNPPLDDDGFDADAVVVVVFFVRLWRFFMEACCGQRDVFFETANPSISSSVTDMVLLL